MLRIVQDDLRGPEIAALLRAHLAAMHAHSPAGSVHALDIERLRGPGITFWSAWIGGDSGGEILASETTPAGSLARWELAGCGALKELDPAHGEVKSMRTADAHLRKGVAAAILTHIIGVARGRGYARLSLETGSGAPFEAAHRLYERFGFQPCGPFADYREDPFSRFFTLVL